LHNEAVKQLEFPEKIEKTVEIPEKMERENQDDLIEGMKDDFE
jgi:hypothetical protein